MSETADLHREVGDLRGTVTALGAQVDRLTVQVEALTAILNQGRGAKYLVFLLPAVIGATVGALSYFGLKISIGH
jgi:hypothetical protein